MKYMMLIYMEDQALNEAEREHCYVESTELAQELKASGHYLAASPLQPTSTATSIRVRDGRRLVTDGPFAETREHLGGYFLVEAGIWTRQSALPAGFRGRAWARSKFARSSSCRICRLARSGRGWLTVVQYRTGVWGRGRRDDIPPQAASLPHRELFQVIGEYDAAQYLSGI